MFDESNCARQSYLCPAGPLQLTPENVKYNKCASSYTVAMLYVVLAVMFISVIHKFGTLICSKT
jgi:hypothetical protein